MARVGAGVDLYPGVRVKRVVAHTTIRQKKKHDDDKAKEREVSKNSEGRTCQKVISFVSYELK